MKKILGIIFSFFLFVCCSSYNKATPKTVFRSVVSISIYADPNAQELINRGTAFAISEHRVITANHICKDAKRLNGYFRIEYFSNHFLQKLPENLSIIKQDVKNDLCMLGLKLSVLKPLKASSVAPEIGDKISIYGSPKGYFGVWTDGHISFFNQKIWLGEIEMILTRLSVMGFYGNSGSPVLNEDGEVIGVYSCFNGKYPYIGYSPSFAAFKNFIGEQ